MSVILYDNFEDGDASDGWTGDIGYWSVTTDSISGTYSGELAETSEDDTPQVFSTGDFTDDGVTDFFRADIEIRSGPGGTTDPRNGFDFIVVDKNNTIVGEVVFAGNGDLNWLDGTDYTTLVSNYSENTVYTITIEVTDKPAGTYAATVNGSTTTGLSGESLTDSGLDDCSFHASGVSGTWTGVVDTVELDYTESPTAPSNLVATGDSQEVSLSWTNEDSDYDNIEVYRALASGSSTADYSLVDTISGTVESYTDTGADQDGERYYYRVRATRNGVASDLSNEANGVTDLPAPTDLSAGTVGDTTADLSWTANHNNGDTRVEVSEGDDGTYSVNTTVAYDTETATATGLLNGQLYGVRVVADTGDAETEDV